MKTKEEYENEIVYILYELPFEVDVQDLKSIVNQIYDLIEESYNDGYYDSDNRSE